MHHYLVDSMSTFTNLSKLLCHVFLNFLFGFLSPKCLCKSHLLCGFLLLYFYHLIKIQILKLASNLSLLFFISIDHLISLFYLMIFFLNRFYRLFTQLRIMLEIFGLILGKLLILIMILNFNSFYIIINLFPS